MLDLLAYWRVLRKRCWTVLTLFVTVGLLVLIGTLKMQPVFEARGLIEIEKENPNFLTVKELFELETVSDTYLETQYKVLRSDALARRVIQQLRLDRIPEFNPAASAAGTVSADSGPEPLPGSDTLETTLASYHQRLAITPVKRSRLVEISFQSHDPELAAAVVNALTDNYIDQSLELRWQAAQKASEWLGQQLDGLKRKLEHSEEELQRYAQENGLLFLETREGQPEHILDERLRQLQGELIRAQAERFERESRYRLVEAGHFHALPGEESQVVEDLLVRLADLRRERAELATLFTGEYPRVRQLDNQIAELEQLLTAERTRMAERIGNAYRAALAREQLLVRTFAEQQQRRNQMAERSVQYNILKREVETNRQLYEALLQRLKEAGVSSGLKSSNIRVVDRATPPRRPVKPNLLLNLILGSVFGLGLGIGAALLAESVDNSLKSTEEIERYLQIPTLAFIPAEDSLDGRRGAVYGRLPQLPGGTWVGRRTQKPNGKPALGASPWLRIDRPEQEHAALAEAFTSLRTSVLLSAADRPPRTLLVTSALPGEGKTTISTNLAISLAQLGQRVLLIDGDMRRPSVHLAFELGREQGLSSYLSGRAEWMEVVQPTGVRGLDVLVCGPVPPKPAELLSGERMPALLEQAARQYHIVIVDSPPVLHVSDSRVLATLVEGVVLVVKAGATPRERAQRARAAIESVGGHLLGVVLNQLDARFDDAYSYSYYRYERREADTTEGAAGADGR
ncbi:MAG: polysaccharide biosynthesis tyrosine autokinase [Firmicutes bacterium]|nr:polysaccharide biosynthesis tyrosine autokinase [Bacillota bacterium]